MYCRKGGAAIEEPVLFGKYRLCRKLGSGRSGTVYLAYHIGLEEYRAIKIVPKSCAGYETFRREALILKTLRHPGIPIVYDVEEDETNSYLIEEYLQGESLYALVKRLGSLSAETAVQFGIQICRLIQFLHSLENPILYLDLQPKNLLICSGNVKLIDFNHARFAAEPFCSDKSYGTVGFAAPEQYLGEAADCRTDIYAIGALLFFMYTGKLPKRQISGAELETAAGSGLRRLILACTAVRREERYQTLEGLLQALTALAGDGTTEHAIKSQVIVFAGARPGLGTTHAALGLSSFLARKGYSPLYREENGSDTVRNLAEARNLKADEFGVYHTSGLFLRPFYGGSVRIPSPDFSITVKDIGASWDRPELFLGAEKIVLVCGGKEWERKSLACAARSLLRGGTVILLFNHVEKGFHAVLPEDLKALPCLRLPFFSDPFHPDEAADACFFRLLAAGTKGSEAWNEDGSLVKKLQKKLFRRFPD